MSLPPSEIPQGAIRFNTDSQKLEFYAQGEWWIMSTDTPNLGTSSDSTPGPRGIFGGGGDPPNGEDVIDYVNISSTGNAIDFGNLTVARSDVASCSSSTRGLWAGGYGPGRRVEIDFVTISSTGNATDFGDLSNDRWDPGGLSNETRGVFASGSPSGSEGAGSDIIEYVTIASTGNTEDFGDLPRAEQYVNGASSTVRGLFGGGQSNVIDYITIATLGDSTDFGDLTYGMRRGSAGSGKVRAIFAGGRDHPSSDHTNNIDFVTIASTGNAQNFGDLTATTDHAAGGAFSPIRGLFAGGMTSPSPAVRTNTIQYITIMTTGNAIDFGDTTSRTNSSHFEGCSNAHGGL